VLDLNPIVKNFTYQVTEGQAGEDVELPRENYEAMLKDLKQKNGFVMAVYEFSVMNGQFNEMKAMCENIISLIDMEIEAEDE
jgi:superfamily I DNA and RNA helicase